MGGMSKPSQRRASKRSSRNIVIEVVRREKIDNENSLAPTKRREAKLRASAPELPAPPASLLIGSTKPRKRTNTELAVVSLSNRGEAHEIMGLWISM
jgi:hypothetical protein